LLLLLLLLDFALPLGAIFGTVGGVIIEAS